MNRRFFLKSGGISVASMGISRSAPGFLQRAVLANIANAGTNGRRKTLITIFQRGAVDGLNMVVPFGDRNYYELRPNIAIPNAPLSLHRTANSPSLNLHPSFC